MMAACALPPSPTGEPAEGDIARYIAGTEPIDGLVAGGYLAGDDGDLVAQQLRGPRLRRALTHSVCHAVRPDVNDFYQEDGEPDDEWKQRRARTVRDHCTVCPVRAACAELALRDDDTVGIRGGLVPEELERRLAAESDRVAAARAEDERAASSQQARIAAAAEVQRLAGQYLGGSVPADKREKNRLALTESLQRRDELVAAHRRDAGWTEAA
ncbi:WhiB family transcriptional regulator [Streptomyces rhizosphaericus]|uniref:WhiB family transcriptional regulator n=1 Tax=Streptomyces rhizosphaericus TaxID=114699 RepID=UPI001FC9B08B|nr:WhiB family transcriptional regulator [Streptomyces rhizosphaericus]